MFCCRACKSSEIQQIEGLSFNFMGHRDDLTWTNYFCTNCGSLSHFIKDSSKEVRYSDSSYRVGKQSFHPPIDLPWSEITYTRHEKIYQKLETHILKYLSETKINILDFGGYNGFTSYGLKQHLTNSEVTVADLDPNGLRVANAIGLKSVNLTKESIDKGCHNLCIINHVLEHLNEPIDVLSDLTSNLSRNCIFYLEVPNLYGFPVSDEAHLLSFSSKGFIDTIKQSGLEILEIGFSSTPESSILYDYPISNSKENLYAICKRRDSESNSLEEKIISEFKVKIPQSKEYFQKKMRYANLRLGIIVIKNYIFVASSFSLKFLISLTKLIIPKQSIDAFKKVIRK